MSEVALNDADIGSLVHQRVPARVPQHVRMDVQVRQAGRLGNQADHVPYRDAGERLATFADEQSVAVSRNFHLGPFDEPCLNSRRLAVVELVRSRVAVFEPVNVKFLGLNVDVRELNRAELGDAQPVTEHQKQRAIVPDRIA